jgi:hypothetical protein
MNIARLAKQTAQRLSDWQSRTAVRAKVPNRLQAIAENTPNSSAAAPRTGGPFCYLRASFSDAVTDWLA